MLLTGFTDFNMRSIFVLFHRPFYTILHKIVNENSFIHSSDCLAFQDNIMDEYEKSLNESK